MKKTAKILLILSLVLAVLALVMTVGITLLQRVYWLQNMYYHQNYGAAGYKLEAWRSFFGGNVGELRQYVLPVGYLFGTVIHAVIAAVLAFTVGKKKGTGMEKAGMILLCGWGLILLYLADETQFYLHLMVPALRYGSAHFGYLYEPLQKVNWVLRASSLLAVMGCGLSLGLKAEKSPKGAAVFGLIVFLLALIGGGVALLLQAYLTAVRSYFMEMVYTTVVLNPNTLANFMEMLPARLAHILPFAEGYFVLPVGQILLALVQLVLTCLCLVRFKGKAAPMALAVVFGAGVLLFGAFTALEGKVFELLANGGIIDMATVYAYDELEGVLAGTVNLAHIAAILCAGSLCAQAAFCSKTPAVK